MYTSFFGLNEKPFSITPDPRYLFLSERHSEALAHLLYGVTESGGFIQLTGEVGTGKTTVVRSLLEQMPKDTEVALVLNPRLTPHEFLLAITEELRVALTLEERNSDKAIVDALNRRLLEAHAGGRRVVLIVDEAQNLSPDVLEQIRLLTNLETAKQKLLQIILIGQPELRQLLARTDLRQLAQRITGRYHLEPLDRAETRAYIRHRLRVAGGGGEIFSPGAMSAIHHAARGVPRLINVICDRALLGAYSREQPRVNRRTAQRGAREVSGGDERVRSPAWMKWSAAAAIALAAIVASWFLLRPAHLPVQAVATESAPVAAAVDTERTEPAPPAAQTGVVGDRPPASPRDAAEPTRAAGQDVGLGAREPTVDAPPSQPPESLVDLLERRQASTDTAAAFGSLLGLWGLEYATTMGRACDIAAASGLRCLFDRGTWGQLLNLDRPAILSLVSDDGIQHQVVLLGLDVEGNAVLRIGTDDVTARLAELMPLWLGDFLLVWRPATGSGRVLGPGASGPEVGWLRESLGAAMDTDFPSAVPTIFDEGLREAVRSFQRSRRLQPDGVAGARTMISLNTALGLPGRPRLRREG
jgi:general secretion pathway protein A